MAAAIITAVLLLAYSNGANDNFKGVATLFGSGTTNYRRALAWATITTFTGSLMALFLAQGLIDSFSGKGLVPDAVTVEPAFLMAVSLGAGLTVLLATWGGLPVSTTHALIGGLAGAGLLATAGQIQFDSLFSTFLFPLLFSPVLAMLLALLVYPVFRFSRSRFGITSQSCICLGRTYEPVEVRSDGNLILASTGVEISTGDISDCTQRYQGTLLGIEVAKTVDVLHYLSAGAVGFARGLNDTPKIVALLLASATLPPNTGLLLVGMMMALGGIINARGVAETMSHKITSLTAGQGFAANLVTSLLVIFASRLGVPVSTTHVSVGSLFGIGIANRKARTGMIFTILTAWLVTLPLAVLLAGSVYWIIDGVA